MGHISLNIYFGWVVVLCFFFYHGTQFCRGTTESFNQFGKIDFLAFEVHTLVTYSLFYVKVGVMEMPEN